MRRVVLLVLGIVMAACTPSTPPSTAAPASDVPASASVPAAATFGDDLAFLRAHTEIVTLESADRRARVAVAPGYQGRVMTSTADGDAGTSFGYIHRPVIAKNARQPHMTVLGGEDRFWLGPEGGQFALYFAPGAPYDAENWQVPEPIDWGGWAVIAQSPTEVAFEHLIRVTNRARTPMEMTVRRVVRLLDDDGVARALGQKAGATKVVAFESENRITNTGRSVWTKASGMPSIWILGMFAPGPRTTVVLPYVAGDVALLGPVVNDAYFGAIAADRLKVGDRAVFFRGDGASRGKIGIPRPRARDVAGSYDPDRGVLTIVRFTLLGEMRDYVNSMWAQQAEPFKGDVTNSYNDGPLGPGQPPLGPFYEIESSSPAAALEIFGTLTHVHRTIHLQGPETELDRIARGVLGVSIAEIVSALPVTRVAN
jgi:hypothetical protein